jgi:hypothetical protein
VCEILISCTALESEVVAFMDRFQSQIIWEQVNTFTYLGCKISYKEEKAITSKIITFLQIF